MPRTRKHPRYKDRDVKGQWRRGYSGNPKAGQREQEQTQESPITGSDDFAERVRHHSDSQLDRMARRLVRDAAGGDRAAIDRVLELRRQARQQTGQLQATANYDFSRLSRCEMDLMTVLFDTGKGQPRPLAERTDAAIALAAQYLGADSSSLQNLIAGGIKRYMSGTTGSTERAAEADPEIQ